MDQSVVFGNHSLVLCPTTGIGTRSCLHWAPFCRNSFWISTYQDDLENQNISVIDHFQYVLIWGTS